MTILAHDEQTIIAQCTPKGSGAIALLRISGAGAIEVSCRISKLAGSKKLCDMATHTVHFGHVVNHYGKTIDQVLFLLMRGPRTFTGQDTVEITCHNNPFIIADIIKVTIEQQLLNALALTDASFEFLDDEISFGSQIKEIVASLRANIHNLLSSYDQQQQIRNGIRIAILGSVNAGKSSLFNAILAQDRAIVTDIPGTTRDTIEAGLYKDGNYWTLIDTAGIRQTRDMIESQGIERSLKEAIKADIILLVIDASRQMMPEEQAFYQQCINNHASKIILIRNKTERALDKGQTFGHTCIDCSCKTKQNIDTIERAIAAKIAAIFDSINAPFLLNERHANLLGTLDQNLVIIESMTQEPIQYELLSTHIKDALTCICQLTGKTISAQVMDKIFSQFCVGK